MNITLRMLTPLWTGGIAGTMDRARETGIIGSLRWWYEAVVRGLGGRACDPSQSACNLDAEAYKEARDEGTSPDECVSLAGLCDVCQVFGATGWRRRFQLRVGGMVQNAWHPPQAGLQVCPPNRSRGWFLPPGYVGDLELRLHGDDSALNRLAALLLFLEDHGAIGAKPQLGYGVFQIMNTDAPLSPLQWSIAGQERVNGLPDLRGVTFLKLRFSPKSSGWWHNIPGLREIKGQKHKDKAKESWRILESLADQGMVPITPAFKNHLRYDRQWSNHRLPRWLFGTIGQEGRIRSKVAVSWAYRTDHDTWEIRGWVHLPQDRIGRDFQTEARRALQETLGKPQQWATTMGLRPNDYRSASIEMMPSSSPFQTVTSKDVMSMLNDDGARPQK